MGDLTGVEYRIGTSDDPDTADVTYTRDRLGRIATVFDAVDAQNARSLVYNEALQLGYEDIPGLISRRITRNYAASGRIRAAPVRKQLACKREGSFCGE
jgi:hypothetical protein